MGDKLTPQLAFDVDLSVMEYPCIGMPKIDGVRMLSFGLGATARSLKPHKNKRITAHFSHPIYEGMDGEVTVGERTAKDVCRKTTSLMGTIEGGMEDVTWHVFDYITPETEHLSYYRRLRKLHQYVRAAKLAYVKVVKHVLIHNEAELMSYYHQWLKQGFEGAVFRNIHAPHKSGRSTLTEQGLLRLKPSSDKEAKVINIEEAKSNTNVAKVNPLGHTERSTAKAGLVPKGMIGVLICEDVETKAIIRVGAGKMSHKERTYFYLHPEEILGRMIKYRSLDTGVKDDPRHARFICFREIEDMVNN